MLTNKEFCNLYRGRAVDAQQGAEAVARLSYVLQVIGEQPDALSERVDALTEKSTQATAELIAEECTGMFEGECAALADEVVGADDLTSWRLDSGAEYTETYTAAEMVVFAAYVLQKYGAAAAAAVKDRVKDSGLLTVREFASAIADQIDALALPDTEFDPVDAARDFGGPTLV